MSLLLAAVPASSHEGHDEAPAGATGADVPRLTSVSEQYELVGVLSDGRLLLYLDRLVDTAPVTNATIELTVGATTAIATPAADGTYVFAAPILKQPGEHEVLASIAAPGGSDLLAATLRIGAPEPHFDHDHAIHHQPGGDHTHFTLPTRLAELLASIGVPVRSIEQRLHDAPLLAGLFLAFGIGIGALMRRKRSVVAGMVLLLLVLGAGVARAGPGHDHDHGGGGAAMTGDAPRRLADGALFLPKPTQRLLDVRTQVMALSTARRSVRLIGRIIADPNRSGLVQSTIGGRIRPPPGGLPVLGETVEAGRIIAYVEPAFAPIDASDVRQTAGDLEQRIALLNVRIARQQRLVDKEVASRANLQDLEVELAGLEARRTQLQRSRSEPEALIAPVGGTIADIRVVAGQVVSSADILVNIVDPKSLWVEAISFDPLDIANGAVSSASSGDGRSIDVAFVGRSRALQQQATVLQFRITSPADWLSIGSPVRVLVETGAPVTGLIVPRNAIAQAPNGEMVTFKRLAPERYQPQPIRYDDLDADRVLVTSGLAAGDQIIVRNAPLVNQIR